VKLFVLTMGLIYAADALNIPIAPLLASLTVAGVGFSFAAKDTVENFFGSVAVILDRPFDIGDWVVIGETEGIIEQVGFRSTRIRTFYNSQVTVPNSNLVRASVDNYGRRRYRRWRTTLCLQYDTTPDQLISFTEGVRELIRLHPYTRKDYYQVWCNEFGESSLDVMLYMFFEVPDWNTELRERERLFLDIVRLANRLQVQFAFPTRTLHVFPGEAAAPAAAAPGSGSETAATRSGALLANELVRAQPWRRELPGPVVFPTGPSVELDDAGNPVDPEPSEAPGG
jgi:MscS family membrane protein